MKRIFDFTTSLLGLIFLSPLLILTAISVRINMGGPVLFRQLRPGKNGIPFQLIKFRTMLSEESIPESQRITKLGRFMRASSLDELPELWNVLKGEMSLVGPRPLLLEYLPLYNKHQMRRHEVLPGITGFAQINGRNSISWEEKFDYDVHYVDHQNFLSDIKIIFLTFAKVIQREGVNKSQEVTMTKFQGSNKGSCMTKLNVQMASAEINQSDIDAVTAVMKSGHLALGPKVKEFEAMMQEYCGVKHAIAVNSGTSALHLIMLAMGIGPGDEVLVPSYTFVATVNCILYVGATPVFVDVDPKYFCFDVHSAEKKITPKTKAIIVVDVFGHPADWSAINNFSKKYNLKVVDDCCEAIGAIYQGQKMGNFGDAGAFAFYPNKQMTTGEGGMIVTNDDEIAKLCRAFRNQGREEMSQWLEHKYIGFNFRLDEMSAALGCEQLKRLDHFLYKRDCVAQTYNELLKGNLNIEVQAISSDVKMSWFVYVIKLNASLDRDDVIQELAKRGVPARAYFSGIHSQPFLKDIVAGQKIDLPVTTAIQQRTMALPFHNNLTKEECKYVVSELNSTIDHLLKKFQAA